MGTNPEAGPGALPRPRGRSWSAREHATDRIEPLSGRRMASPLSCSFVALRAAPSVLSSWPTHPISLEHRQESSARITRSGYSRRFPDHLPSRQTRASGFAPSRRAHPFPLPPRPGLTFRVRRHRHWRSVVRCVEAHDVRSPSAVAASTHSHLHGARRRGATRALVARSGYLGL